MADATTKPAPALSVPELPDDPRASFDPLRSRLPSAFGAGKAMGETEVDFESLVRQCANADARKGMAQRVGPPADIEIPVGYSLHRLLGRGGFGEVWEAIQTNFGRRVAVKRLRGDLREKTATLAAAAELYEMSFRQEALTAGALDHPNIVPVHAFGMDSSGAPVLAMKLVRGRSWLEVIEEDWDVLSVPDFLGRHLPILIDMAQAAAFAHSRGILHRDLKPSQVMVGEFGEVLLADWGLAIAYDTELLRGELETGDLAIPTTETATNPAGTVAYMAPEQTEHSPARLGPWTDTFLLGGTLYYLLTHTPPWNAPISIAAFAEAMRCEVQHPRERAPEREVPFELGDLAMEAMRREPSERPQSVRAFIDAVRDYLTGAGRRRESHALVREGLETLENAAGDYRALSECVTLAERAVSTWPNNAAASELAVRAHAAYSRAAIQNRDLVLGRVHAERLPSGEDRSMALAEIAALEEDQRAAQARLGRAYELVSDRSERAEDLMTFMLTDLYRGLKPIGRLDLLDKVVTKALDFFGAISDEELSVGDQMNAARSLRALGEVQRERGNLSGARATHEKCLKLLHPAEDATPELYREFGMAWLPLGDVLRAQGDMDASLDAYRRSLEILSSVAEQEPRDWKSERHLFIVHERLGYLYEHRGEMDDALAEYGRALAIAERLATEQPADPERRKDISFALNRIGDVHRTRGHHDAALAACSRALEIRRVISVSDPSNMEFQRDLSVSSMQVGDILVLMGDYGWARATYEESMSIAEHLAHRDPDNASRQSDYALALGNVAEMHRLEGRPAQAEERHRRALEIHFGLARHDPSNTFHAFALGWTRVGLGKACATQGREDEARRHWEEALAVLLPVTRTNRGANGLGVCAQALLLLGRVEEARPIADELLGRGWRERDFLALCAKSSIA